MDRSHTTFFLVDPLLTVGYMTPSERQALLALVCTAAALTLIGVAYYFLEHKRGLLSRIVDAVMPEARPPKQDGFPYSDLFGWFVETRERKFMLGLLGLSLLGFLFLFFGWRIPTASRNYPFAPDYAPTYKLFGESLFWLVDRNPNSTWMRLVFLGSLAELCSAIALYGGTLLSRCDRSGQSRRSASTLLTGAHGLLCMLIIIGCAAVIIDPNSLSLVRIGPPEPAHLLGPKRIGYSPVVLGLARFCGLFVISAYRKNVQSAPSPTCEREDS